MRHGEDRAKRVGLKGVRRQWGDRESDNGFPQKLTRQLRGELEANIKETWGEKLQMGGRHRKWRGEVVIVQGRRDLDMISDGEDKYDNQQLLTGRSDEVNV